MGITANQNARIAKLALFLLAFAWVNLAAALGNDKAVNSRDWLRRQLTAEQVTKAEKLTAELRECIEASKSD